jgi:alpha-1,4-N-acetylglucosaminyltransferase EXTL3
LLVILIELQSETELERIKNSVKIELRELERYETNKELSLTKDPRTRDIEQKKVESVRKNVFAEEQHLKQLKSDVANYRGQIQALERELRQKAAIQNPPVMPPERIFPPLDIPTIPYRANIDCSRGDCFDYTRCPLTGGFPVYLYPINHIRDDAKRRRAENIQNGLRQILQIVEDANTACIWFFISERVDVLDTALIEHWHGDGRNHVVLDLSGDSSWADIGRASKMGTGLAKVLPFDLLLPEPIELHQPIWEIAPLMTPIQRAHRLVFQFSAPPAGSAIVDQLALLKKQPDNVIEPLSCGAKPWANCGTLEERLELLSTSTFSLVLVENNFADVSERLLESLLTGAVPVVLSYSGLLPLPLDGVIDWSRASLQLPLSRLPELSFLLSSMTSGDIFDMRRQGRFLLEEYFSSEVKSVYSGLQMLRHKIGLIPNPYEQTQGVITNIEKFYPPTLPAEPNFLDEEAKDEFVSIQVNNLCASSPLILYY